MSMNIAPKMQTMSMKRRAFLKDGNDAAALTNKPVLDFVLVAELVMLGNICVGPKKREKGRKLPSQPVSSRCCFLSKCRNFRSDRKGKSSKERSQTATEEPKKRRVQSLHLLRSNEAEQQRRREKMKGKP
ncbi:hypothetical protein M5K25_005352 [Dendrobium thyrsiflorum]|uniref:Uncharacterized protein n=1 Tax=Dendrobium thyrsiflorum TaxID=117978 RepID=A0ABD0VPI1_DENTH